MSFWKWSRTASSNASADGSINWAEGMAPSAVNDSARAMMAAAAKYRDDVAGAITTGGTSTAYTVASFQGFDTLAHLDGRQIAFVPHTTNGATVTLAVDGLTAKPLRSAPSTELLAGVLVQGTPYVASYNNSDGAFYLQGFFGNPYNIPLGGLLPYTGSSAPNSSFVLPSGQAISRSTYASYFSLVGTTYGTGDGSTTFNVIDLRGRLPAGKDDMGGSAASRIGSVVTDNGTIVGATLGSTGGSATHVLTSGEMPVHNHGVTDPGHTHVTVVNFFNAGGASGGSGNLNLGSGTNLTSNSNTTGITIQNAGSGGAHAQLPPTIIVNYILRIL